jgi:hypothetical protein
MSMLNPCDGPDCNPCLRVIPQPVQPQRNSLLDRLRTPDRLQDYAAFPDVHAPHTAPARLLLKYADQQQALRGRPAHVHSLKPVIGLSSKNSAAALFFSAISCDPANRSAFSSDCFNKTAGSGS